VEATQVSTERWIDKENVVYMWTMEYYSVIKKKKQWHLAICDNMGGPTGYYSKWNKSDTKRQIYMISFIWGIQKTK